MAGRRVGRITSHVAFDELQRSRARGASGAVRAVFVPVAETERGVFPQFGYSIGRRCGGAVTRNALRRRARAVAQSEAAGLPRGRFLVRLDPGAAGVRPARFRADVATALWRAAQAEEKAS